MSKNIINTINIVPFDIGGYSDSSKFGFLPDGTICLVGDETYLGRLKNGLPFDAVLEQQQIYEAVLQEQENTKHFKQEQMEQLFQLEQNKINHYNYYNGYNGYNDYYDYNDYNDYNCSIKKKINKNSIANKKKSENKFSRWKNIVKINLDKKKVKKKIKIKRKNEENYKLFFQNNYNNIKKNGEEYDQQYNDLLLAEYIRSFKNCKCSYYGDCEC